MTVLRTHAWPTALRRAVCKAGWRSQDIAAAAKLTAARKRSVRAAANRDTVPPKENPVTVSRTSYTGKQKVK